MADVTEQRRIAQEVFEITGTAVPEDDAIVLAALFYARKMQDAGRDAARQISSASASSRTIVEDAAALVRTSAANNKFLADAFEVRLQKALRQVISAQSSREGPPQGWRGVLAGVALGMFTMAGIVSVACQGSFAWVEDAKVGRMFSDIYPKLSPAAQAEVMKRAADYLRG